MKSNTGFYLKDVIRISKTAGIAFFVLISGQLLAQSRGTLTIVKDPRIDTLLALRLAVSKMPNNTVINTAGTANGFRVQFFTGATRTEAFNAQSKLTGLYPDVKTYIIYSEPNFKVRAGDFRTRQEATVFMQQLRSQFTSLFIISEKINLTQ